MRLLMFKTSMLRIALVFLILYCALFINHCFGQSSSEKGVIESLEKELLKCKEQDTTYINLLYELGGMKPIYRIAYWDSLAKTTERALKKYKSEKEQQRLHDFLASIHNNIGFIYLSENKEAKAMDYFKKSFDGFKKINHKLGMADAYSNIGYIYEVQGNIPQALSNFHMALKLQEQSFDKAGAAQSHNNIGVNYYRQEEYDASLTHLQKSLALREEIKDSSGISETLVNLGSLSKESGDLQKTLGYYEKALEIRKRMDDQGGVANTYNNIGAIYFQMKKFEDAKRYFEDAIDIQVKIGNNKGLAFSYSNLGGVYFELNDIANARKYTKLGFDLANSTGYPETIEHGSRLLSKIERKEGNYKEALEMYTLHIKMRDSLKNEETQKASIRQQANYEYEKRQVIKDAEYEKQLAIEHKEKEKQQLMTYAVGGGLMLVLAFLVFVFNRLQITQKQKRIIEEKERETHLQKEIIEDKHKEITDSINYAERIQRSFLATKELLDEHLNNYFVFFRPKDVVSGDFYWAGRLNNGNFAVCCADSTGHGVPGAIMSILNISSLEKSIEKETEPHRILNQTRTTIIERLKKDGSQDGGKDGMDCTFLSINPEKTKLSFAAANNPVWVVRPNRTLSGAEVHDEVDSSISRDVRTSRLRSMTEFPSVDSAAKYSLIEFKPDKMPVGKHDRDSEMFTLHTFDLQKGDVIYTLTDGMPDQFGGPKGKKFKSSKMKELILSIQNESMDKQKELINDAFEDWKGELEQVDDVCVIGVRI